MAKTFVGASPDAMVDPRALYQDLAANANPTATLNKFGPVEAMHEGSTFAMNHPRISSFLTLTEKGYDPAVARQMVEDKMFKYGAQSFTPFENRVLKRVFPFYCVPTDHEILTRDGFKTVDQLAIGEEVLAFNQETYEVEWTPLQTIHQFDFDGELMKIEQVVKGRRKRFLFTEDHRWPVRYELPIRVRVGGEDRRTGQFRTKKKVVSGHDLQPYHRIPCAGEYRQSASVLSPRLAAILGWVVTDGYFRWRPATATGRGLYPEMIVYQSPKKFANVLAELLDTKPRKAHPVTGVLAFNVKAADRDAIIGTGYFDKRHLVSIVTRLSREAAEAMWEAMFMAEGCTNALGGKAFGQDPQYNPEVLEAFQILCLLTGRSANLAHRGCYIKKSRHYCVNKSLGKERYRGTVWCPQTKLGTWIMRHDGAVIVTGNSFGKQATATTLKELAERPGGPTGQVIKATAGMTDTDNQMLPDYIKQGMAIPIPEGTPLIGPEPGGLPRYLTTVGMMHERYPFAFMGGGLPGAGLETLAQMNPLLKLGIEGAMGRSTFQRGPGGPRELTEQDPLLGRLAANISDTITGDQTQHPYRVPYLENLAANSPASAWLTMARTGFDPRKSLTSKAVNLLTGAKLTDVTPASQQAMLQEALKGMMEKGGARSYENVYFPKDELANMPPDDRLNAMRMQALMSMLAKQDREAAKARAAAQSR